MTNFNLKPVKPSRIFGILLYDTLIIMAILLVAISLLFGMLQVLGISLPEPNSILFRVYLLAFIFGYYHISWSYLPHGQTVGMKVWQVVLTSHKPKISLSQSLLRITGNSLSILSLGLGFILKYFNTKHQNLADMISGTQLRQKN